MSDEQDGETKTVTEAKEAPSAMETLWSAWAKWLKRAGIVATLSGTFLALFYFFRIGYMPLDSLSSLAGLSTAIAFVSIGGLGLLIALWGMPAFLVQVGFVELRDEATEIFRKRGTQADAQASEEVRASTARVLTWCLATLGLPWFALLTLLAPDYIAGCDHMGTVALTAIGVALLLILALSLGVEPGKGIGKAQYDILRNAWPRQRKVLIPTLCYSAVSVLALMAFVPLAGFHKGSGGGTFLLEVVVCIGSAVALNALAIGMAFLARKAAPERLVGLLVLQAMLVTSVIALILTAFSAWGAAHDWVMVKANVRLPNVRLVLDKATCEVLPPNLQQALPKRSTNEVDACAIDGALVLSTVGTRWLIAVPKVGCARYAVLAEHVRLVETADPRPAAVVPACRLPQPSSAPAPAVSIATCPF